MKIMKKTLSMLLVIVMVLGLLPVTGLAVGGNQVYITISEEGRFIEDSNGDPMAYRGVSLDDLAGIDLNDYGLSDYIYDPDGDGKQDITALHLYIYVHEELLGLDWSDVDCSNGAPASMYFTSGLFGYEDENLRYNYNGAYPADENGWGFTADNIVLSAGDFLDVAHYSDWMFYCDSAYGFHHFTDADRNICYDYTAEVGENFSVKLLLVGGGMGMGDSEYFESEYTVYYGRSIGQADGSVKTNMEGVATVSFPSVGTWYIWCDGGLGMDAAEGAVVSSPTSAAVSVTAGEEPEQPRQPQTVSSVINATMAELADTVTAPAFGTNAGEWTVLCLARGGYYAKDNAYFTGYYGRIVETVNETAASVNMNGALHKNKSTDNARLIVALSSIGKNATSVGNWDLVEAYSANGINWIKKQGLNGPIWALIALDSGNYTTSDATLRQQCVDYILDMEMEDGGWKLNTAAAALDVDITGMTLQALYPYRDQPEVAAAAERAFTALSDAQLETGGFMYGTAETSESAAQVIVACATWGINPDTDSRFIKNGNSVVDNLLSYYIEDEAMFAHQGTTSNNMATDQACYALIAYDRLLNGGNALYDMSDVTFGAVDEEERPAGAMKAELGVPEKIENRIGTAFNGVITLANWDNAKGHKLIDLIVSVPNCLGVTDVSAGSRLNGGAVRYHLEESTGKLRIVYFDAERNNSITVTGTGAAPEFFTIGFRQETAVPNGQKIEISITGMSVKNSADSGNENSQVIVDTGNAKGVVEVAGLSFSAVCLYEGDSVDLIPNGKKAVAVAVTGIEERAELTFCYAGSKIVFRYSGEISGKTGVNSYVALVDAAIPMEQFVEAKNYETAKRAAAELDFGDVNGDGVVNAQDALATVDAWLRKDTAPGDEKILRLNVNGDSRINTFDALGIVEHFVNGNEYAVVTRAATLATKKD